MEGNYKQYQSLILGWSRCLINVFLLFTLLAFSLLGFSNNKVVVLQPGFKTQIGVAQQLYDRGKYDDAEIMLLKNLPNIAPSNRKDLLNSYFYLSGCYAYKKEFKGARKYLNKAYCIYYKEKPDIKIISDLLLFDGYLCMIEKNHQKSIDLLKSYLRIQYELNNEVDTSLLGSYYYLVYNYSALRKIDSSEFYLKKIEKICSKKNMHSPNELIMSYYNLGVCNYLVGNFFKSFYYYSKQAYHANKSANKEEEALAYCSLAYIFRQIGEHEKALTYYEKSIAIYKDNEERNFNTLAIIYNNISYLCFDLEKYNLAYYYIQQSLNIRLSHNMELFTIYFTLAQYYQKTKQVDNALLYYTKSLTLINKNKAENLHKYADILSKFASFYVENHQLEKAKELAEKSNQVLGKLYGKKHPFISDNYLTLGNYYLKKNDYDNALNQFNNAIKGVSTLDASFDLSEKPFIPDTYSPLRLLKATKETANCLFLLSKVKKDSVLYLEKSARVYEIACQIFEKTRFGYESMESKLWITNNEKQTYEKYLFVLNQLNKCSPNKSYENKMFEVCERSKAGVMRQALKEQCLKQSGLLSQEMLLYEKYLNNECLVINNKLTKGLPAARQSELQDSLFIIKQKISNLIEFYKLNATAFYKNFYENKISQISEVQSALPANQAILEFSISDSILYSFFINKQHYQIKTTNLTPNFYKQLALFIDILHKKKIDTDKPVFQVYEEVSFSLYQILMQPFKDYFEPNLRLKIVPDGILSYLPFEALVVAPKNEYRSYANLSYLLNYIPISYAYAATIDIKPSNITKQNKILAFAPTYKSANSNFIDNQSMEVSRNEYDELVGAKIEVEAISKSLQTEVLLNENATPKEFKELSSEYNVLHLALHANINDTIPNSSGLVFTINNNEDVKNSTLTIDEIVQLKIPAKLAVLSACNTGDGKYCKGEGIISIARAFFYAGCQSLILTLWSQNDESGAAIMPKFYNCMQLGNTKDVSLQQAKIEYLNGCAPEYSHPYYWANYIQIGNDDSVVIDKKSNYLKLIFFISVIAVFVLIFFRKILI